MPGLPFRTMPGAQQPEEPMRPGVRVQDPAQRMRGQFNQQRQYLHRQWRIEADALRIRPFKSQAHADSALAKLNSKYRMRELGVRQKLETQQQERQRVQQLIQQTGRRTPIQEVALRMQLGPEAERLVFPPHQKPFTYTQIVGLADDMREQAGAAKQEPRLWRGQKKTRKSLIKQYLAMVKLLGVSDPRAFGPGRQQQFNDIWNRVMEMDKDFANWFDEQGKPPSEMRVVISKGRIADAMKDKVIGKSPLGRSISRGIPRTQYGRWGGMPMPKTRTAVQRGAAAEGTIRVRNPAGQTGTISVDRWPEAEAAGYTRI